MRKNILLFTSLLLLLMPAACSRSGHAGRPELEQSLSLTPDPVPLSFLSSLIGTGSGSSETFGDRCSMLVFYAVSDCTTCAETEPAVAAWIRQTGCKVYKYTADGVQDSEEEQQLMLRKLGSEDGVTLTAGRLIAFSNGRRIASISGSYELETPGRITRFVSRYFSIAAHMHRTVRQTGELESLASLRAHVASHEKFVLLNSRYSCPWCRKVTSPQYFDAARLVCTSYRGAFYELNSEKVLGELSAPVTVDGTQYKSAIDYLRKEDAKGTFWPPLSSPRIWTAEIAIAATALSLVPPCPGSTEDYLKALAGYASSSSPAFTAGSRLVPSFIASGYPAGTDPLAAYFTGNIAHADTGAYRAALSEWLACWK